MSSIPDASPTAFFAMPTDVSACAPGSSSPSSWAIARADSARRRPSSRSSAITRVRAAAAATRAAGAAEVLPAIPPARGGRSSLPIPGHLREIRLRLGRTVRLPSTARLARPPEPPVADPRRRPSGCSGLAEHELGALRVVFRPERERVLVLRRGYRDAVQTEGAVAGVAQRAACVRRSRRRRYPKHGRARVRSSSGRRASPRGPPAGRGSRSTRHRPVLRRAVGAAICP